MKLATICDNNGQQRDARNNVSLKTEWTRLLGRHMKGLLEEAETGLSRSIWWHDCDDDVLKVYCTYSSIGDSDV